MDKFLETHGLLTLNQEESENLTRQITANKIEAVIKKFSANKSSGLDGITGKFDQTYKEELTLILLKLFPKIQEEEKTPKLFL